MTLKEKFIKCRNKTDEYYILPVVDDAKQLEKIADEFAIGFKDWCGTNGRFWIGANTTKELLEIYKKEKGL